MHAVYIHYPSTEYYAWYECRTYTVYMKYRPFIRLKMAESIYLKTNCMKHQHLRAKQFKSPEYCSILSNGLRVRQGGDDRLQCEWRPKTPHCVHCIVVMVRARQFKACDSITFQSGHDCNISVPVLSNRASEA